MLIIIPGNPVPAARPRVTSHGTYNPKYYEMRKISQIIKSQWKCHPLVGPVFLNISFFMSIPKSLSIKKQKIMINKYHIKRPDIDNLEVMLYNALVKAEAIIDDSQISSVTSRKVYSDNPRTEVEILMIDYDFNKDR